MIQSYKLQEEDYRGARFVDWHCDLKGNNDLLVLTQPQIIKEIHSAYLEAGADILETNTFNSTTIAMADYDMQSLSAEINFAAAKLAREVADEWTAKDPSRPRYVAGVLGPTNRTCSISPDVNDPGFRNVTFDGLVEAYSESTRALIKGGSDLILIETIFDTLTPKPVRLRLIAYLKSWHQLTCDDFRHDYRCLWANFVWTDDGSFLQRFAPCTADFVWLELCVRP